MNSQDNRNLLLAIGLSMIALFGWSYFVESPQQEPAPTTEVAGAAQPGDASGINPNAAPDAMPMGSLTPDNAPGGSGNGAGAMIPGMMGGGQLTRAQALAQSERVLIDSPRLHGSIALKGGRIDDLILNDYQETIEEGAADITLLSPAGGPAAYFAEFGWTGAGLPKGALPGPDTVWTAETGSTRLGPDAPIILRWTNDQGLTFRRTIALDENYMFTITDSVQNNGEAPVTLYPYGRIARHGTPETTGFYILHEGLMGVVNTTLEEVDYDDIREEKVRNVETTGGWIGITDKYWMTALIPDQNAAFTAGMKHRVSGNIDRYQTDFLRAGETIGVGATVSTSAHLFAGAKEVNLVDSYGVDLGIQRFDLAIDWGWFYFLTKPMFFLLDWFNSHIGNFGIAILALTLLVKIIFFPLANKSYESMSKMKKVQPEMMKIRERYADDKVKQQQELMDLYKKEKVNPASGCLPMLVQIPVFFALYKVLFVSIEMRHAPFYGWVHDLSAPDPTTVFNLFGLIPWDPPSFLLIGIWPLLMGVSMFLQQKLNPPPPDPIQARMFMLMPIFFTFLLGTFPAGLVIYWTFNNVLSIAQQYLIMRRLGVPIGGGTAEAK